MRKTHKEKVTLQVGEAYVIADQEFWNHVISMYESQAEDSEDAWSEMANYVRSWVNDTLFIESEEDDQTW